MKRTICLDFDGVVHSYTSGWKGPRVIADPPMPGAFTFMLTMLANDWDVCVHSSRSGAWGGRRAMRKWMKHWALSQWWPSPGQPGLEDVRFPLFKPPALLTIDDRAMQFTGQWPDEMECRAFKPWKPLA